MQTIAQLRQVSLRGLVQTISGRGMSITRCPQAWCGVRCGRDVLCLDGRGLLCWALRGACIIWRNLSSLTANAMLHFVCFYVSWCACVCVWLPVTIKNPNVFISVFLMNKSSWLSHMCDYLLVLAIYWFFFFPILWHNKGVSFQGKQRLLSLAISLPAERCWCVHYNPVSFYRLSNHEHIKDLIWCRSYKKSLMQKAKKNSVSSSRHGGNIVKFL